MLRKSDVKPAGMILVPGFQAVSFGLFHDHIGWFSRSNFEDL